MRHVALTAVLFAAAIGWTQNQPCLEPAPPAPPTPRELVVLLPIDGGTQGCEAQAAVSGGREPQRYPIGNAKCATAVQIAKQAAANDNGWNDGGAP